MGRPSVTDVDRRITAAIRARRRERGCTQQELAGAVGVSMQQLHKYESGINRVSAAMLAHIAQQRAVLALIKALNPEPAAAQTTEEAS